MHLATPTQAESTLELTHEVHISAPLETTFAALLRKLGPENEGREGAPMPMTLEARPGGRWFRDLGADDGHFWGHVQAIKRPTLLEIAGPLFMSYAAVSNVQYRLEESDGGTLLRFSHTAVGLIAPEHREGLAAGWPALSERTKVAAEAAG